MRALHRSAGGRRDKSSEKILAQVKRQLTKQTDSVNAGLKVLAATQAWVDRREAVARRYESRAAEYKERAEQLAVAAAAAAAAVRATGSTKEAWGVHDDKTLSGEISAVSAASPSHSAAGDDGSVSLIMSALDSPVPEGSITDATLTDEEEYQSAGAYGEGGSGEEDLSMLTLPAEVRAALQPTTGRRTSSTRAGGESSGKRGGRGRGGSSSRARRSGGRHDGGDGFDGASSASGWTSDASVGSGFGATLRRRHRRYRESGYGHGHVGVDGYGGVGNGSGAYPKPAPPPHQSHGAYPPMYPAYPAGYAAPPPPQPAPAYGVHPHHAAGWTAAPPQVYAVPGVYPAPARANDPRVVSGYSRGAPPEEVDYAQIEREWSLHRRRTGPPSNVPTTAPYSSAQGVARLVQREFASWGRRRDEDARRAAVAKHAEWLNGMRRQVSDAHTRTANRLVHESTKARHARAAATTAGASAGAGAGSDANLSLAGLLSPRHAQYRRASPRVSGTTLNFNEV